MQLIFINAFQRFAAFTIIDCVIGFMVTAAFKIVTA